jgi:hypothetical protein
MSIRPFAGTLVGAAIGLLALIIWVATFEPHGGSEWSRYLFPVSAVWLERMFPSRAIPVSLWYSGALLHWIIPGALVDLLRRVFRKGSSPPPTPKVFRIRGEVGPRVSGVRGRPCQLGDTRTQHGGELRSSDHTLSAFTGWHAPRQSAGNSGIPKRKFRGTPRLAMLYGGCVSLQWRPAVPPPVEHPIPAKRSFARQCVPRQSMGTRSENSILKQAQLK